MILVHHQVRNIALVAGDERGGTALAQPLHRVYLRGVLGGVLDSSDGHWRIPLNGDPLVVLQSIVTHFDKYKLICVLDERCKLILEEAEKKRVGFRELLRQGLKAKKGHIQAPNGRLLNGLKIEFVRQLTPRQRLAVNHLLVIQNGANFSVPGSGKTSVALAYYHLLKKQDQLDALLVIGPGSCFAPWENEYASCFGSAAKSLRLAGNSRARRVELLAHAGRFDILLTTYHSAARDVEELVRLLLRRRYLLVLDESHYVKRPQGGKLAEAVLRLSRFASKRLILTGTPMPNGLNDLWSQFTFLWPEQLPLGGAEDYLQETNRKEGSVAIRTVRDRISPLFFRITKSQLGLARPSFKLIRCDLGPLQSRIYTGVASRFLTQLKEAPKDRDAIREWRRARAVRLLQIATNPTLLRQKCDEFRLPALDLTGVPLSQAIERYAEYEKPSKIVLTCRLARELCGKGDKVIIWSTFVHNLRMVANELKDLNPTVVYGDVPMLASDTDDFNREALITRFRMDPRQQVLVANPAACAESISLHMECHHAIYLDRSFNCAHYLQSLDRIHRLGLPKSVKTSYYLLIARESIDEVVHERLKHKVHTMHSVIEGDMPGIVPGYWSEDLGDEEEVDLSLVEKHIRSLFASRERKAT